MHITENKKSELMLMRRATQVVLVRFDAAVDAFLEGIVNNSHNVFRPLLPERLS